MSLAAIAAKLDSEGRPTAHGGRRWHVSTVQRVLGPAAEGYSPKK